MWFSQEKLSMRLYANLHDLNEAGKSRNTTFRVNLCTVITRYTTCRICDLMRHVVVYRRETAVLQDSSLYTLDIFAHDIAIKR